MTDDVVITITTENGKKIFNIDVGDMPLNKAYELFNRLETRTLGPRPEGGHSFEEQYWNGFISYADVPMMVEGWAQAELAEQYRSDQPNPAFVDITRQKQ